MITDPPLRILLADDENSILDLYDSILTTDCMEQGLPDHYCFHTTLCHQAEEAVQAVASAVANDKPYAMVFLDYRMPPGPDGIWAAEEIRKLDSLVNIMMVTAYPEMPPRDLVRRVPPWGRFLMLQKPLLPMEIMQVAAMMADKWRAEKTLSA
jgi:two-component system, cell cycle sensor histidine kinase and response regulator CckA